MQNLDLVFEDRKSPEEKEQILKRCFRNFALLVLDLLWFSFRPHRRMPKWFIWDESFEPLFSDGAKLILTAHYGNWETVGQAFAERGQPICSVAAPLKNRQVDRLFIRLRQQTGQKILPQQGAARALLKGLKQGAIPAVLLDQNTRVKDGGMFVPFFGREVPVSSAPAALALKSKTDTYMCTARPTDTGHYQVRCHTKLEGNPDAENPVADLTARMTAALEPVILEAPEFWCWMYKRWKFIPPAADGAPYPAYAIPTPERDLGKHGAT